MAVDFEIPHIALHLVHPAAEAVKLSPREIDIDHDFSKEDEIVVRKFLSRHVFSIWGDETATSSDIAEDSEVVALWNSYLDPKDEEATFLATSESLAKHLLAKSPKSASRGLLLVLHVRSGKPKKDYLALIKLDPGDRDLLRVGQQNGEILLRIAVEHIALALPDPAGVLKWAVLPHPTEKSIGAKLKDRQVTDVDAAAYFMNFLGGAPRRRDYAALNAVIAVTRAYVEREHPQAPVKAAMPTIVKKIAKVAGEGKKVTPQKVARIIEEEAEVPAVDSTKLEQDLKKKKAVDVELINPDAVDSQIMTYALDNKIKISGPAKVMESQVAVTEEGNTVTFTITAGDYKIHRSG